MALSGLGAAPSFAGDACVAGYYEAHATEIAAALRLGPDGTYDFQLVYGALDEESHGVWKAGADAVLLTSEAYKPPDISLEDVSASADGGYRFELELSEHFSRQYFDVRLEWDDGSVTFEQMQEDGLGLEPGTRPVAARLVLPIFDLASDRVELPDKPARLKFQFSPNDIGKASFTDYPLAIDGGDLVMQRHGRELRFERRSAECDVQP
ncbi:MAG: hypothetical protein KDE55_01680 [Novosphingobium sp.]|nr:hypothetical protein [Novosphingobium sp.]